jgi:hypothetical protein
MPTPLGSTYSFGSGVLFGTRTGVDTSGNAVANQTPINFGLVQEVTIDSSFNLKELYGQYQFPVTIARGTAKITGKAKTAKISAIAFNDLFLGMTRATTLVQQTSYNEGGPLGTAIPGIPFTITVTNTATFVDDLGVIVLTPGSGSYFAGQPLIKVASAPTAGQYSVNGSGVYTFASADNVSAVKVGISYTYTQSTGTRIPVTNQLLGYTPTFQMQLFTTFQGNDINVKFYNVTTSKLAFQTKLEDFVMPEFDFSIFADSAGRVYDWSYDTIE